VGKLSERSGRSTSKEESKYTVNDEMADNFEQELISLSSSVLPGAVPAPSVVVESPSSESSNESIPRVTVDCDEGGAPPPFEINVQRATPTNSGDDESCAEEETELHLDITTAKHMQPSRSRPLSVASHTLSESRTNSSLLAIPDNIGNMIRNLANRARGKTLSSNDPFLTPTTSVSDLRMSINTGMLKKRLDSFARRPESDTDSEVEEEKTQKSSNLCKSCTCFTSRLHKVKSSLKKIHFTCHYYVDPYGKNFGC